MKKRLSAKAPIACFFASLLLALGGCAPVNSGSSGDIYTPITVVKVEKVGEEGNKQTFTITFSDGTTTTYYVTNGEDGLTPSIGDNGNWFIGDVDTGVPSRGENGKDGRGIKSIEKTSTSGNVDQYTVTFTDDTTATFTITNGKDGLTPHIGDSGNWYIGEVDTGVPARGDTGAAGAQGEKGDKGDKGEDGVGIVSIEKTDTQGNVDYYTVTFTDGSDFVFTIENAASAVTRRYNVTFDANKGVMPEGFDLADYSSIEEGTFLDLPTPYRDGYYFLGWYTGKGINDGQFTNATPVNGNFDLVAKYVVSDAQYFVQEKMAKLDSFYSQDILYYVSDAQMIEYADGFSEYYGLMNFSADSDELNDAIYAFRRWVSSLPLDRSIFDLVNGQIEEAFNSVIAADPDILDVFGIEYEAKMAELNAAATVGDIANVSSELLQLQGRVEQYIEKKMTGPALDQFAASIIAKVDEAYASVPDAVTYGYDLFSYAYEKIRSAYNMEYSIKYLNGELENFDYSVNEVLMNFASYQSGIWNSDVEEICYNLRTEYSPYDLLTEVSDIIDNLRNNLVDLGWSISDWQSYMSAASQRQALLDQARIDIQNVIDSYQPKDQITINFHLTIDFVPGFEQVEQYTFDPNYQLSGYDVFPDWVGKTNYGSFSLYSDPECTQLVSDGLDWYIDPSLGLTDLYLASSFSSLDYGLCSSAISAFYNLYFNTDQIVDVHDDQSYQEALSAIKEFVETAGKDALTGKLASLQEQLNQQYPDAGEVVASAYEEALSKIESASTLEEILSAAAYLVGEFYYDADYSAAIAEFEFAKAMYIADISSRWDELELSYPSAAGLRGDIDYYLEMMQDASDYDQVDYWTKAALERMEAIESLCSIWTDKCSSSLSDAYAMLSEAVSMAGEAMEEYDALYNQAIAELNSATDFYQMGMAVLRGASAMLKARFELMYARNSGNIYVQTYVPGIPTELDAQMISVPSFPMAEGGSYDLSALAVPGFEVDGIYLDSECTMLLSEGGQTLEYSPVFEAYSRIYVTYRVTDATLAKDALMRVFDENVLGGLESAAGEYGLDVTAPEDVVSEIRAMIEAVQTPEDYDAAAAEMVRRSFADIGSLLALETFKLSYAQLIEDKPELQTVYNQAEYERLCAVLGEIDGLQSFMERYSEAMSFISSLRYQ